MLNETFSVIFKHRAYVSRVSFVCIALTATWVSNQFSLLCILSFVFYSFPVTYNVCNWMLSLLMLIVALYGVLFTGQEVTGGFSNYRLWESTGFLISYILQAQVCVDAKLWILISTLAIGMAGYLTVEYIEQEQRKKRSANWEDVIIQTWNNLKIHWWGFIQNSFPSSFLPSCTIYMCTYIR